MVPELTTVAAEAALCPPSITTIPPFPPAVVAERVPELLIFPPCERKKMRPPWLTILPARTTPSLLMARAYMLPPTAFNSAVAASIEPELCTPTLAADALPPPASTETCSTPV